MKKTFTAHNAPRYVVGYEKSGEQHFAIKYRLKPIPLKVLQKLFNIPTKSEDPAVSDMIYCFDIEPIQAAFLQNYLDEKIDWDKYDYMLEVRDG